MTPRRRSESAREAIRELEDGGRVPWLAADVGRELAEAQSRAAVGELLDPPSTAELAVLRLLDSDLSVRQIGEELFLSANTVRTHTRVDLSQAERELARGCGRARRRARAARAIGFTHVIQAIRWKTGAVGPATVLG